MIDGAKPTVLLIDDDARFARSLTRILAEDYSVVVAGTGAEASRLLVERGFDLVLADLRLPDTQGLGVVRLVRTYDLDVPIIVVTGFPDDHTAIRAVEMGALQYMHKPLDPSELRSALARGVSLSRLARTKRIAAMVSGAATPMPPPPPVPLSPRSALNDRYAEALASLRLVFQPIYDRGPPPHGKLFAYEALLRTAKASPHEVLTMSEELGQIWDLGRRIRRLAAEASERLPAHANLFVNLHAHELGDEELYGEASPLSAMAGRVVLEVTERAPIDAVDDLGSKMRTLRAMGYRIAVDDMGAGYAGLSTFAALEPEIVKIDMSLVRGIDANAVKQRVVRSVTALCHDLGIRIVAEGVEVAAELATLTSIGCDFFQGFLLGRPGSF